MITWLHNFATRVLPQSIHEEWDVEGFAKYFANTGWMFFARIGTIIISFFVSIYVIRYLGPHNYGLFSYAVSFVSIFSFIVSLGLDQIIYRELVNKPEREREIMGSALILKLIGGTAATLITITTAYLIPTEEIDVLLIAIISLTLFGSAWQIITYPYQARVLSKYPSLITLAISAILACAKLLVVYFDKGIIYFAAILVLESILYAVFYIFFYTKHFGSILAWTPKWSVMVSLLKDSLPIIFSTVSMLIYARIDQVMIRHYLDASAVGLYDAAVRLSDVWYIIPNVLIGSLFAAILNARKVSHTSYMRRFRTLALFLFISSLCIILPTTLLAPFIISIFYGSAFSASAGVLSIYIWSILGFGLGLLMHHYLVAENYVYIYFFISLITMIINIGLNIVLIPTMGINGAALATLVSYSLIPVLPFIFSKVRVQFFSKIA